MGKVLLYLPDGIGLRNFAFGRFIPEGKRYGHCIEWWNETSFPVGVLTHCKETSFPEYPVNKWTYLLNRSRKRAELKRFCQREADEIYATYNRPLSYRPVIPALKSLFIDGLTAVFRKEKGILNLRKQMRNTERKTRRFSHAVEQLRLLAPNVLFCTNQRTSNGIVPIEAARELGIPSVCFIFSWDNLPKATMVLDADYYFVWSDFMKNEILQYYPHIAKERVKVVGTPQFERHTDVNYHWSRERFCSTFGLNPELKFCCFSGDDVTTSPYDPRYLKDLARTVEIKNRKGHGWHILFRPSPVDQSGRYKKVLSEYSHCITEISPAWKSFGQHWNQVYPTPEDHGLLINTILHSEMVFNVGSSMVFDFAILNKPCCYLNYNPKHSNLAMWRSEKIYNYIHFRSMPEKDAVFWAESMSDLESILNSTPEKRKNITQNAKKWFSLIVKQPAEKASENIWIEIDEIINT